MAIDIMQTLVELLCPTYSAQSACNTFINAPHHQVLDPFGPLLYFLFFPTVFLILFIYVGSRAIFSGNKGINLLIGVAVYIFIIINGAYPIILWIGEFWFVAIFIIFFLYLLTRRHAGGERGGSMPGAGGGFLSTLARRGWSKATGAEKADADYIDSQINLLDNTPKGGHGIDELSGRITTLLRDFRSKTSIIPGVPFASDYNRLLEKYKKACKKKGLPTPQGLEKIKKAA